MDGRGLDNGRTWQSNHFTRKKSPTLPFSFLDGRSTAVSEASLIDLRWWMLPWYVRACAGALSLSALATSPTPFLGVFPLVAQPAHPLGSPPKIPDRTLSTPHYPHFLNKWNIFSSMRPCCYMAWCRSWWITNRVGRLVWDGRNRRKWSGFECILLTNAGCIAGTGNGESLDLFFFFLHILADILRELFVRITTFKSSRATFLVGYSGLGNESTAIAYNSLQTFFTRDFLHIGKSWKLSRFFCRCQTAAICVALL